MSTHQQIEMKPVTSSQIKAIGYHHDSNTLAVEFHGKGVPGNTYHYHGVAPDQWSKFQGAESHGKHFHAHIRDKFKHTKLEKKGGSQ